MNDWSFRDGTALFALWVIPALGLLAWRAHHRTKAAARAFAGDTMQARILPPLRGTQAATTMGLFLAGLAMATLAWARPTFDFETITMSARGLDIVVALDVSRSMLAKEGGETRLDRARASVRWLVEGLRPHRLGLIAFAGEVLPACPLTLDHGYFLSVLDELSPGMVGRGGTRLGPALDLAAEMLDSGAGRDRILVLLSDAGDQDSLPLDAAASLAKKGIRVVTVGIGRTEDPNAPLVIDDQVVRDKSGQPVLARVNGELLSNIALKTEGIYVPPDSTGELPALFDRYMAPLAKGEATDYQERHPKDQFGWFLAPAVLLLLWQLGRPTYPAVKTEAA